MATATKATTGFEIGRPIGVDHPPFIVAALDGRRLGGFERAIAAIDAAADSRCDAVKLTAMPWSWCARLFTHAESRGIAPLATALDENTVSRLDWCGAPAFALAFDCSDLDLIACAARTGKPIVVSVGRATDWELAEVVETARSNGNGGVALVHSAGSGLERLDALLRHRAVVGVSDLLPGRDIPRAAITRGASIVEKRLDLPMGGEIVELAEIVRDCEQAWASRGAMPVWPNN
jgi:N-acetylneuraminate synthase